MLRVFTVALLLIVGVSAGLDVGMVRDTLSQAMRCYGLEKLQLGVALQDGTRHAIRLQMHPDGSVTEMGADVKFFLASVSKGMFAVALTRIEQNLRSQNPNFRLFTTPVNEWFDNFWFLDHERSKMVTIDDMVSHSTGLARHDLLWYLKGMKTKEEVFRHTGRLKATAGFRSSFVYNNLVWTIADLAVERLTKKNFTTYMREFLWSPLGMRDTHGVTELTSSQLKALAQVPNYRSTSPLLEISMLHGASDVVEAAGGIVSTLDDMLTYGLHLIASNYTSLRQLPDEFKALNGYVAHGGINEFLHSEFFNETVTDLPQVDMESYSKGWFRLWYRDNLVYGHSGSLHGIRSKLDLFLKRGIAVFSHATLGSPRSEWQQGVFVSLLNNFVSDLLLQNSSFANKDNICHLFKDVEIPDETIRVQRRELNDLERSTVIGRFSSFGWGTVEVSLNRTTQNLVAVYGFGKMELIPVRMTNVNRFEFFVNLLEPAEHRTDLVNTTDPNFISGPKTLMNSNLSYLIIEQQAGKVTLKAALFEPSTVLEKDLDPSTWTRPEECPISGAPAEFGRPFPLTVCMLAVSLLHRL